ncbi:hypothetical protein CPJCM30710_29170 [Clostridium polyendosporum]|uniref:Uncharacterized protein n=1 Tax=Clostridium polyendosporum TaxID=69208 RepID=A0A919S2N7_9CLOT|nr:hypothetical protein [Clostridium polyendosporum]GIM30251.1 hypothetical protein CPJCM30710_29170 [Clostridium polyendosporum]
MKKLRLLVSTLAVATLVVGTSVTAFAKPKDDVVKALKQAKAPDVYIIKTENYLKTNTLTEAQTKEVVSQIDKIRDIVKAEKVSGISQLSKESKAQVLAAIEQAANAAGLTASLSKNVLGTYVLTLFDGNGKAVVSATADDIIMKKAGSGSFVLVLGSMMIIAAAGSLMFVKRVATA